jgi:hypothetical protein
MISKGNFLINSQKGKCISALFYHLYLSLTNTSNDLLSAHQDHKRNSRNLN